MSTVPPIGPPTALPQSTGDAPAASISRPPSAVRALPAGATIEATVASFKATGQAELKTPFGALQVSVNIPLKPDQAISLLVQPQAQSARAFVLQIAEIDGKPAAALLQTTPNAGTGAPPSLPGAARNAGAAQSPGIGGAVTTPAAPASVNLIAGQSVTAVILGPAPNPTPAAAVAAPSLGSDPHPPQAGGGAAPPTAAQTPAALGGRPSGPLSAPSTGAPVTQFASFPAGTKITLSIQSVAAPATPAAAVPVVSGHLPAVGQSFTALISGVTPSGQPMVQTPAGMAALENAPSLPKGTEVVFRVESAALAPNIPERLQGPGARAQLALGRAWPALDDVASALAERAPSQAAQLNAMIVPQADAKLGSTLLFLLSALKAGDLKAWIGETVAREIERIRPDALRRFRDDVRLLAGDEIDTRPARAPGDWRTVPIPFQGDGMEYLRLMVRRDGGEEADTETRKTEKRFVVDLKLTSIGRLQLDGLIDIANKRFDMLVRTDRPLPNRFRRDVLRIFSAANDTIGMNGGLAFRAAPDAIIEPDETALPARSGGIVV